MFQFYERVPKRDCDFYEKITQLRLNLNQSYIDLCKYHFPTEVALLRRNRGKIGQSLEYQGRPSKVTSPYNTCIAENYDRRVIV